MDLDWRKVLGILLVILFFKIGCSIWKEKVEDRVGFEASSVYLIYYLFNYFGLKVFRGFR